MKSKKGFLLNEKHPWRQTTFSGEKKKDEMRGNHTHKKYIVLRENSGKRNMTHL